MRRRRGRFAILALVLFGFLLGHDALMAADPHHQDRESHVHAADVGIVSTCPMPDTTGSATPYLPLSDVVNVACVMGILVLPSLDFGFIGWDLPPEYPPGMRRAFLQVFLN